MRRATRSVKKIRVPSPPWTALSAKLDRKSTRLNSSHGSISYAVFCLKKKTPYQQKPPSQTETSRPSLEPERLLREAGRSKGWKRPCQPHHNAELLPSA